MNNREDTLKQLGDMLIGESIDNALDKLKNTFYDNIYIERLDGCCQSVTYDCDFSRVNVWVVCDKISKVVSIG
jgi:hypothetical protein